MNPQIQSILKKLDLPSSRWMERWRMALKCGDFRATAYCGKKVNNLEKAQMVKIRLNARELDAMIRKMKRQGARGGSNP